MFFKQLLTSVQHGGNHSRAKNGVPVTPPEPGLYHYQLNPGKDQKVRLHLRVDSTNNGILSINASRLVHLNHSAVVLIYYILEKIDPLTAIKMISKQYGIPKKIAQRDYTQVNNLLSSLIHPENVCPIHDLDIGIAAPFTEIPSAPYRMDLAITYRCQNNCLHCYNDRSRIFIELSTDEWKKIIDTVFKIGIPHIVFTGGEPTLRSDLVDLISYAEAKGLITGLNTNGRLLNKSGYLQGLVNAGLDHVQITIESHDSLIHDEMVGSVGAWTQTIEGIKNALKSPLFVMTNTTMLIDNSPWLGDTLDYLGKLGISTVGLNALIYSGSGSECGKGLPETELSGLLKIAAQKTENNQQRLIWYTPTQYCHFDPTIQNLGVKGCTAALYNMCIEPNGDVIPCQSYYRSVGNILHDDWDEIWNHELCVSLRERSNINPVCRSCLLVNECGGGCPLAHHSLQINPIPLPDPIHAT